MIGLIRTARLALAQRVLGPRRRHSDGCASRSAVSKGRTPLQMCVTGTGTHLVEEMLVPIEEAMFA
jgi:hypothetical protein